MSLTINGPVNLANSTSSTQIQGPTYIANYINSAGNIPSSVGTGMCVTWNYATGAGETDFWNQYSNNSAGSQFRFYGKTSSTSANLLLDLQGPGGNTFLNTTLSVNGNIYVINDLDCSGNVNSTGVISSSRAGAQFIAPGYMHYSDGSNYYLLLTGSGPPTTIFNGLRPFYINLNNGLVSLGNTNVSGTLNLSSSVSFSGASYISNCTSTHGAVTIQGSANGYSGINFTQNGVGNLGTFMVQSVTGGNNYTGYFNETNLNWLWGFQGGTLIYGNVPENKLSNPSQSLNTSGYRQLPGGLILQWTYMSNYNGDPTWTFPITFPNACVGVYGTISWGGSDVRAFGVGNVTNSSVVCRPRYTTYGGYDGTATDPFYVYAIGF